MKIEFNEKQLKFLLEMVNVLNFPGKEAENVFEIKKKIEKGIEETTKK